MPLALNDPHWKELRSSYGDTDDVVLWLSDAYKEGLSDERLGDLINEVQHQGDTTSAMYAVAPHLIALAQDGKSINALNLLIHAGLIYAASGNPKADSCPEFLKAEFINSASKGAHLLAPFLPLIKDVNIFICAVAALAGFIGHNQFARFLECLDFYKGRFYHVFIDGPIPVA